MRLNHECETMPRTGRVEVATPEQRRRWARAFDVTETVLLKAVELVGNSIGELRKLFCPEDHGYRPRARSEISHADMTSRR